MNVYTVHEPPNPPADRIERAEKLEFVRDGFTWLAAMIPPLWMALNRLWIALLAYLLTVAAAGIVLGAAGVNQSMISLVILAAHIVIGFEADNIRRWTLEHRGWDEVGTVTGRNRDECERRFFDGWIIQQPFLRTAGRGASAGRGSEQALDRNEPGNRDGEAVSLDQQVTSRPLWRRLLRR
jgi:Protein of unknown function (DUF2628)